MGNERLERLNTMNREVILRELRVTRLTYLERAWGRSFLTN